MRTASIIIALIMEPVRISETSVYYNEPTRRYMPDGSDLQTRSLEDFKSHTIF
jgi:hypothetical protein